MLKVLTIDEIKSQYEGQWVLVEDPQTDDDLEVQAGRVGAHSDDRDEVYRQAIATESERFAIVYAGEMPHDAVIIL